MLQYDHGVLSATTAFGKTVVCSYLISQRKVNTLILLQSKDLLEQWVEELHKFLNINEEPPVYKTKTGREKKRDSVIGVLTGNKNTLTGMYLQLQRGATILKKSYICCLALSDIAILRRSGQRSRESGILYIRGLPE